MSAELMPNRMWCEIVALALHVSALETHLSALMGTPPTTVAADGLTPPEPPAANGPAQDAGDGSEWLIAYA